MNTAWFIVKYEEDLTAKPFPLRWCAVDKYTPQIEAESGCWEEIEIKGNQAIVKVKASQPLLNIIANEFQEIPEARLNSLYRGKNLTRIPPRFDTELKKIVFDRPPVLTGKSVDDVDRRVK